MEGSEALVELLAPALEEADPELLATIREQFATLYDHLSELGSFEDGFVHYSEVTQEQKDQLAADLGALAESLSLLNGTLGLGDFRRRQPRHARSSLAPRSQVPASLRRLQRQRWRGRADTAEPPRPGHRRPLASSIPAPTARRVSSRRAPEVWLPRSTSASPIVAALIDLMKVVSTEIEIVMGGAYERRAGGSPARHRHPRAGPGPTGTSVIVGFGR